MRAAASAISAPIAWASLMTSKARPTLAQAVGMEHSQACKEAYMVFRRAKELLMKAQRHCLKCRADGKPWAKDARGEGKP